MDILPEPLYKWTNLDGNDLLKLIYTNPKRWGLTQVRCDISTINTIISNNDKIIVKSSKMYNYCICKYCTFKIRNPTAN